MALTLSPALAALHASSARHGEKRGFFRWFESAFERLRKGYVRPGRAGDTGAGPSSLLAFAGIIAGVLFLFKTLPSSFVPDEDQGYFFAVVMAPDTASVERRVRRSWIAPRRSRRRTRRCRTSQSIAGYSLLDGQLQNNAGIIFASLKPFEERTDASNMTAQASSAEQALRIEDDSAEAPEARGGGVEAARGVVRARAARPLRLARHLASQRPERRHAGRLDVEQRRRAPEST